VQQHVQSAAEKLCLGGVVAGGSGPRFARGRQPALTASNTQPILAPPASMRRAFCEVRASSASSMPLTPVTGAIAASASSPTVSPMSPSVTMRSTPASRSSTAAGQAMPCPGWMWQSARTAMVRGSAMVAAP
jgi:hypothetical protein